ISTTPPSAPIDFRATVSSPVPEGSSPPHAAMAQSATQSTMDLAGMMDFGAGLGDVIWGALGGTFVGHAIRGRIRAAAQHVAIATPTLQVAARRGLGN